MEELVHRALSNAQVKEGTNERRHEGSSDCGCVKRPDERGFASLLLTETAMEALVIYFTTWDGRNYEHRFSC